MALSGKASPEKRPSSQYSRKRAGFEAPAQKTLKNNFSGEEPLKLFYGDEDKMKKIKLSLASFILSEKYYERKQDNITFM